MIDGIPVFDCVIHVYDMSDGNLREDESTSINSRDHMVALQAAAHYAPGNEGYPVATRWSTESVHEMVFTKDWFAPVQAQYEMAKLYPDEVLFCGGVDPVEQTLPGALDEIQRQTEEMGARSFKLYNGHIRGSWRCDDETLAYPLYQRCQDLGIDVIQFHKGSPFGQQNLEDLSPLDLQAAARDFPDLKFVIHHAAIPYFNEALNIASRFPNVYIALSGIINFGLVAPRMVEEWVGALLAQVGSERLLWGSEAALQGCPLPFLEWFVHDFEISEDLRVGYGYPQITREDKERILGGNFAELMKVDLVGDGSTERSALA